MADKDLEKNIEQYLKNNEYPGRVIIIGLNEKNCPTIVYAIMGRTENSQNRFFEQSEVDIVRTAPIDKTKVKDPELIIYNAMAKVDLDDQEAIFIVTNGRQTDALYSGLRTQTFQDVLREWKHEPDAPNYTSRISGAIYISKNKPPKFSLSIIKADEANPENISTHEFFENLPVVAGTGFGISTYAGNGNPLPAFRGQPFQVELVGNAYEVAQKHWNLLNPDYRVALLAKVIDPVQMTSTIAILNR